MNIPAGGHSAQPVGPPTPDPPPHTQPTEASTDDDDWIPFRSAHIIRRRDPPKAQPQAEDT
jgi:hypothetical protein